MTTKSARTMTEHRRRRPSVAGSVLRVAVVALVAATLIWGILLVGATVPPARPGPQAPAHPAAQPGPSAPAPVTTRTS
jgi:hypothetical protein